MTNAEDLILLACDTLVEDPRYERSILNPDNYQLLLMLEHAKVYFPGSIRIKLYLMKVYAKLGCSRKVVKISKTITCRPDDEVYMPNKDFERLGAINYSTLSSYGPKEELVSLLDEY